MREGGDDANGDSDGDGGWWGRQKVPPTGHGGAMGCQKGGEKGMLLSHHSQGKMERSSCEGVTNEPGHQDMGPHCPPGPDGPWNKSPPAGMSCPCQSCSSGPDARCPGCCGHQHPIHPPCAFYPRQGGEEEHGWVGSSPVRPCRSKK